MLTKALKIFVFSILLVLFVPTTFSALSLEETSNKESITTYNLIAEPSAKDSVGIQTRISFIGGEVKDIKLSEEGPYLAIGACKPEELGLFTQNRVCFDIARTEGTFSTGEVIAEIQVRQATDQISISYFKEESNGYLQEDATISLDNPLVDGETKKANPLVSSSYQAPDDIYTTSNFIILAFAIFILLLASIALYKLWSDKNSQKIDLYSTKIDFKIFKLLTYVVILLCALLIATFGIKLSGDLAPSDSSAQISNIVVRTVCPETGTCNYKGGDAIQTAINASNSNDVIFIEPGTYTFSSSQRAALIHGKSITIEGPAGENQVTFDGGNQVDNGIIISDANGSIIRNIVVKNFIGSGIIIPGSNPLSTSTLENVRAIENGHGLALITDQTTFVRNSVFWKNTNSGVFAINAATGSIVHSLASNNGTGFYSQSAPTSNPRLTTNLFISNSSSVFNGEGYKTEGSGRISLDYSHAFSNELGNRVGNNITIAQASNPLLESNPRFVGGNQGHGWKLESNSPLIDAGNPVFDDDPNDSTADIGIYGGPLACLIDPDLGGCSDPVPTLPPTFTGKVTCNDTGQHIEGIELELYNQTTDEVELSTITNLDADPVNKAYNYRFTLNGHNENHNYTVRITERLPIPQDYGDPITAGSVTGCTAQNGVYTNCQIPLSVGLSNKDFEFNCQPRTDRVSEVFVTSSRYSGDLRSEAEALYGGPQGNGIESANAICQHHATSAGLGGSWVAWIAGQRTDTDHNMAIHSSIPLDTRFETLTGELLARDYARLTSRDTDERHLRNDIHQNELGQTVDPREVWTGLRSSGIGSGNNKCNAWTGTGNALIGLTGTFSAWTDGYANGAQSCEGRQARLYCFQIDEADPPPTEFPGIVRGAVTCRDSGTFVEGATVELIQQEPLSVVERVQSAATGGTPPNFEDFNYEIPSTISSQKRYTLRVTNLPSGHSNITTSNTTETLAADCSVNIVDATRQELRDCQFELTASEINNANFEVDCETSNSDAFGMFVTSKTYTGDLVSEANNLPGVSGVTNGLEAGDAICQSHAESVGLGEETWIAWLSDVDIDAKDRITLGHKKFKNFGPEATSIVANNLVDLASATSCDASGVCLTNPVLYSELKEEINVHAWTGTSKEGIERNIAHCENWTNNTTATGEVGKPDNISAIWTDLTGSRHGGNGLDCSQPFHLYCLQQTGDFTVPTNPEDLACNIDITNKSNPGTQLENTRVGDTIGIKVNLDPIAVPSDLTEITIPIPDGLEVIEDTIANLDGECRYEDGSVAGIADSLQQSTGTSVVFALASFATVAGTLGLLVLLRVESKHITIKLGPNSLNSQHLMTISSVFVAIGISTTFLILNNTNNDNSPTNTSAASGQSVICQFEAGSSPGNSVFHAVITEDIGTSVSVEAVAQRGITTSEACTDTVPVLEASTRRIFIAEGGNKSDGDIVGFVNDNSLISDTADFDNPLDAADALCEGVANVHGYSGEWSAWLSSEYTDALERISDDSVSLVNLKNQSVISPISELSNCTSGGVTDCLDNPVKYNGINFAVVADLEIWTGTNHNATKAANTCTNWSSDIVGKTGEVGTPHSKSSTWTQLANPSTCDMLRGFYCIEQEFINGDQVTINILEPQENDDFQQGSRLSIALSANDSEDIIDRIELTIDSTVLGEAIEDSPEDYILPAVVPVDIPKGSQTLIATAYDSSDQVVGTDSVEIEIIEMDIDIEVDVDDEDIAKGVSKEVRAFINNVTDDSLPLPEINGVIFLYGLTEAAAEEIGPGTEVTIPQVGSTSYKATWIVPRDIPGEATNIYARVTYTAGGEELIKVGSLRVGIVEGPEGKDLRTFVTSDGYQGDIYNRANTKLGESFSEGQALVAADALCQDHAEEAGLTIADTEWKALLGHSSLGNAKDRLTGITANDRIYNLNPAGAQIVADGLADLGSCDTSDFTCLINPISFDENGDSSTDNDHIRVWSGVTRDGTVTPDTCDDWTNNGPKTATLRGIFGNRNHKDTGWTGLNNGGCNVNRKIYCFEQRIDTTDKPDLTIESVSITQEEVPVCGEQTTLGTRVVIKNNGTADASAFEVELNDDSTLTVEGLTQNESIAIWFDSARSGAGQDTKVIVDSQNEINESDETNNVFDEPVAIPTVIPTCTTTPPVTTPPVTTPPVTTPPVTTPPVTTPPVTDTVTPTDTLPPTLTPTLEPPIYAQCQSKTATLIDTGTQVTTARVGEVIRYKIELDQASNRTTIVRDSLPEGLKLIRQVFDGTRCSAPDVLGASTSTTTQQANYFGVLSAGIVIMAGFAFIILSGNDKFELQVSSDLQLTSKQIRTGLLGMIVIGSMGTIAYVNNIEDTTPDDISAQTLGPRTIECYLNPGETQVTFDVQVQDGLQGQTILNSADILYEGHDVVTSCNVSFEVEEGVGVTPSITYTPTPEPSSTPIPTNTITPSDTPVPSGTITPSGTIIPSGTVIPSDTPIPTSTPEVSFTPTPTVIEGSIDCGLMDIDEDGNLKIGDFASFATHYPATCQVARTITTGCGGKDSNGDGLINVVDLQSFASRYFPATRQSCTL